MWSVPRRSSTPTRSIPVMASCPRTPISPRCAMRWASPLSAGGGGRGMRVARDADELAKVFPVAQVEAQSNFGNGGLYLERLIERCHHVEIQIAADRQGHVVHLGERECSVQRRHQKMIEESP